MVLAAVAGHRLFGAVRAGTTGIAGVVGLLVVAPGLRRRGIARALLTRVEAESRERRKDLAALTLFTGAQSPENQRPYQALGYAESSRERAADHLVMVHMRKELEQV